jgi:hypothetical protein
MSCKRSRFQSAQIASGSFNALDTDQPASSSNCSSVELLARSR